MILALLVVLLGVSGFFGLKLYSEAKQVKAHEEQAMQLLGGVTDLGNLDNLDTGPIGTFVVLITVARPCGSRRVGLSFLSRGK